MQVQPYLFFGGHCEEALNFYQDTLGAEREFMLRAKEAPPDPAHPIQPGSEDKIVHATLKIGDSILMCSDGHCDMTESQHQGYALSLNPQTVEEGEKLFTALQKDGGEVVMPYQKTFWALSFGMVKDQFNVLWMISVEDPDAIAHLETSK